MERLEQLWTALDEAKRQLDFAHKYLTEVKLDKMSGDIPQADGGYAHLRALQAEEEAANRYTNALQDLKAALMFKAPTSEEERRPITAREREVLTLIASGKSSKEIAEHLGIAFRTVVCHRYRVQTKLNVHKVADLTRAAMRMGLVEL